MKNTSTVILLVTSRDIVDILKSASLSVHGKYPCGNSEAYGNLQDEEYPPDPAISYFYGRGPM